MSAITSPSFQRLVQTLKKHNKTVSVVEQCCGGLIQTSIMAQPGASRVYIGGCIPYNTSKTKPLLLNSTTLHQSLLSPTSSISTPETTLYDRSTSIGYMNSKYDWTTNTAIAFCHELPTVDYVISEGGAAGPTFQPSDMTTGFTVISIAGRSKEDDDNNNDNDDGGENDNGSNSGSTSTVKVVTQKLIQSTTNNRQENMRLFADAAADLLLEILTNETEKHENENDADDNADDDNKGSVVTTTTTTDDEKKEEKQLTLDRCTVLRSDEKALEELERIAKYIIVLKTDMLFKKPSDHELSSNSVVIPELALLSYEDVMNEYYNQEGISTTKTFLGRLSDEFNTPIFSIDILDNEENDNYDGSDHDKSSFYVETDGHYFSNVRTTAPLLNTLDNGMALHAMAYANWQRKNNYCTNCGGLLELLHGNTCQKCASCQTMSWPRQDPSMIVSIISRCGSKILLARSPRHPPKMHTVLAGFVEVGETFESAVARETFEEVGIRIDLDSIKYIGSQPWPFPQSCMIAFTATADDTQELTIDTKELIDAKWFSREDVFNAASKIQDSSVGNVMSSEQAKIVLNNNPSLSLLIPPKRVIARTLIDEWLYNTK